MTVAVDAQDLRLLAEIGFLGIGRGLSAEAAVIFAALRALRPEGEAGYVGGAAAALSARRLDEAAAMLRAGPQTEAVLAFRALVFAQSGDARRAKDVLQDLGFMNAAEGVMAIAEGAVAKNG